MASNLQTFILLLIAFLDVADSEICTESVCEFRLRISNVRTMTGNRKPVEAFNNTHFRIISNGFNQKSADVGAFMSAEEVISADGFGRSIVMINGEFPGPTLEVMEGAKVLVHVENHLVLEPLTIHWHGIYQTGSPWMDGPAYASQCPILPSQSFTYSFLAQPAGTHWYHSHFMSQRLDGLYGAFLVHPALPTLPYFPVIIGDWYHETGAAFAMDNPYTGGSGKGYQDVVDRDYMVDGNENGFPQFISALINGRGRHKTDDNLPLRIFDVSTNTDVDFRIISASGDYFLELSIDGHGLHVTSTDGHEVVPVAVDNVVVGPGERFDVRVRADNPGAGSYWLRARVLRNGKGPDVESDGIVKEALAILRYDGSTSADDPTSSPRACTPSSPCKVLNCPYPLYPPAHTCIPVTALRSAGYTDAYMGQKYGLGVEEADVLELFYNFGFVVGSSVNGRRFSQPRAPLFTDGHSDDCDDKACDDGGCTCTNIQSLPGDRVVQLVISSVEPAGTYLAPHSIHLHGHSFAVLKMGYCVVNSTTGRTVRPNEDLTCNSNQCTTPKWTGARPELNLDNPVLKDSLIIPPRGYAVVRFRTDNPGYWYFHCHQETHFHEGMGLIFKEGDIPPPPPGFPTCGDYDVTATADDVTATADDVTTSGYDVTASVHGHDVTSPAIDSGRKEDGTLTQISDMDTYLLTYGAGKIVLDLGPAVGILLAVLVLGAVLAVCPLLMYISWMRKSQKTC